MADNPSQILEATESFVCELDGERVMVHAGTTRVAAGAAVAKAYPNRFSPIEERLSFGVEEATAEPGRPRQRQAARREEQAPQGEEQPGAAKQGGEQTTGLSSASLRQGGQQSGGAKPSEGK